MKKLLIACCLLLASYSGFATCIAIYVAENGHIYIAADSRRTFFFSEGDQPKFETVCKIHHVGNNYFAISGIDDGALLKGATKAIKQNANIYTAVKCFGIAMSKHYKQLMEDTRIFYPKKFPKFLKDGLASVSFFGYYSGLPNVYNIDFLCSLDRNGAVIVSYQVKRIFEEKVIGISKDIEQASLDELPRPEVKYQSPGLYVEALVKIEARMQPLAVSEPIDLMELKPEGAVWIRKNEGEVEY